MKAKAKKQTTMALGALAASLLTAAGGTITWGVSGQGLGDVDYFNDGSAFDGRPFTFELGYFKTEAATGQAFSPTIQNIAVWEENWVRVGASSMYDRSTGIYGGQVRSADFATGTDADGMIVAADVGTRVFIWGYDSRDLSTPSEWVLYTGTGSGTSSSEGGVATSGPTTLAPTDLGNPGTPTDTNWVAPLSDGNQGNFAIDWEPATADFAVIGRVPPSGDTPGDGEVDNPQPLGRNTVQTATVPEPAAPLLFALSAFGFLAFFRRR